MDEHTEGINDNPTQVIAVDKDGHLRRPSIMVDYEFYEQYLASFDADEEYKRELVQSVWSLMFQIASCGFDLHPLQQVEEKCGRNAEFAKVSQIQPVDSAMMTPHQKNQNEQPHEESA